MPKALVMDGRAVRTARSRQAICEACLDLIEEGVLQPSADAVCERAGVSRRSVFNHFRDLAELFDAVGQVSMERYAPLLETVPSSGTVEQRVKRLVGVRAKFFEATAPVTRALTAQALAGPSTEQAVRVSREALEIQARDVERVFERELSVLPAGERAEVVESLASALAPLQWEHLRRSRQHTIARARGILERTLISILRSASTG